MQSHDQNSATWSINNVIFALTLLHTNTALIPMLQLPLARINLNFRPTAQPLSCGVQSSFHEGVRRHPQTWHIFLATFLFRHLDMEIRVRLPFPIHLLENKSISYQQFHHPLDALPAL